MIGSISKHCWTPITSGAGENRLANFTNLSIHNFYLSQISG